MNIGERIKQRRKELGLSVEYISEKLGKNRATVYRYENSDIEKLPYDVLEPLARLLETTPLWLLGVNDANVEKVPGIKTLPIVGSIAAGLPLLAEENIEDYFSIDARINATFCLKVKGDSMIDEGILNGDIAFIKKQDMLENGEIGAILIDGEATLKKFYKTDHQVILQPANKYYSPIVLNSGEVKILGKLVAVLNILKQRLGGA